MTGQNFNVLCPNCHQKVFESTAEQYRDGDTANLTCVGCGHTLTEAQIADQVGDVLADELMDDIQTMLGNPGKR